MAWLGQKTGDTPILFGSINAIARATFDRPFSDLTTFFFAFGMKAAVLGFQGRKWPEKLPLWQLGLESYGNKAA
jgi:hypothetical protein